VECSFSPNVVGGVLGLSGSDSLYDHDAGSWFLIWLVYIIIIFIGVLMGLGYGGYKLWRYVFNDDTAKHV
jgi:hypothetical protein